MSQTHWQLDARLQADTLPLGDWPVCRVLLMDDTHYPWLILVPRVPSVSELVDLSAEQRAQAAVEVDSAAHALRDVFAPDKLNVAALGNVVNQLHIHVIARFKADAAWPAPVWGAFPVEKRPSQQSDALSAQLREALHARLPLQECT